MMNFFSGAQNSYFAQTSKVLAGDLNTAEQLGYSIAISGDGSTIIAGAPNHSTTPTYANNGAAYIYTRSGSTWTQQAKLLASDLANTDEFGSAVAISSDGNTVLIGALYEDNSPYTNNGAAYVFTRSGSTWTQQAKLLASDAATGDYFGWSVALSSDGNTALIGSILDDTSPETDRGSGYVFTRSGSTWTQQAKLLATDGLAYDEFGHSVALSSDGNTALIGAPYEDTSPYSSNGAAYVFTRSGSTWTQQAKLLASDAAAGDYFGWSVALSSDGNTALIGAAYANPGTGTTAGVAYIFTRSGSTWTQQAKLVGSDTVPLDLFGYSVALSSDGNTALLGSPSATGSAYLFYKISSSWIQSQKIQATDATSGDQFGFSVSLSSDGNFAAIGAVLEDTPSYTNNGAVYAFAT